jgi:glycine cleavage system transcriptional repressor
MAVATPNWVITGFGHNCPGIVAALTRIVMAHGCNLEDSRMAILGGEFTVIVLVQPPSHLTIELMQQALTPLQQSLGFSAVVKPLAATQPAPTAHTGQLFLMRVSGTDRTGITCHASQLLADRGLDITDLQAHRFTSEDGPVYLLLIEFWMPDPTSVLPGLQQALTQLGQALGVETGLTPVDTGVL